MIFKYYNVHSLFWNNNLSLRSVKFHVDVPGPLVEHFRKKIEVIPDDQWTEERIKDAYKEVSEAEKVTIGKLYMPTRYLITGTTIGAGMPETMFALGKDTCIRRLNHIPQR